MTATQTAPALLAPAAPVVTLETVGDRYSDVLSSVVAEIRAGVATGQAFATSARETAALVYPLEETPALYGTRKSSGARLQDVADVLTLRYAAIPADVTAEERKVLESYAYGSSSSVTTHALLGLFLRLDPETVVSDPRALQGNLRRLQDDAGAAPARDAITGADSRRTALAALRVAAVKGKADKAAKAAAKAAKAAADKAAEETPAADVATDVPAEDTTPVVTQDTPEVAPVAEETAAPVVAEEDMSGVVLGLLQRVSAYVAEGALLGEESRAILATLLATPALQNA